MNSQKHLAVLKKAEQPSTSTEMELVVCDGSAHALENINAVTRVEKSVLCAFKRFCGTIHLKYRSVLSTIMFVGEKNV